jgi:hypothetical protein
MCLGDILNLNGSNGLSHVDRFATGLAGAPLRVLPGQSNLNREEAWMYCLYITPR